MEKYTASVRIGEKTYKVSSSRGVAYVQRVAELVNRRSSEVAQAARLRSQEAITVAALITFAEELVQAQEDNQRLRQQLSQQHEAST